MPKAFSISADAIARESKRVGGDLEKFEVARVIQLDECVLRALGPKDVHLRILAVSGEHNVDHAALADTVNIAELRGGKIYPGNSALGEVVSVGSDVKRFKAGEIVITHCNGEPDIYGYPLRIWAYDQPDSIGWYGEEAIVGDWQILPAPLRCGLNLWEIAALPLRAPTAYHLWRRAIGIFRVKVGREQLARLNVLAFGGGVSELFLMLAKHEGHRAIFCSGSPERRKHLEGLGIETIDQKAFHRFASPDDVKAFNKHVKGMTGGEGAHIVCDMLRGPVFAGRARGARALRRERQLRLADRQEGRLRLGRALGATDHARSHALRDARRLQRRHDALRQRLQADRALRDLPLRGSAALLRRAPAQPADGHPDRAGRPRTARRRSLPDPGLRARRAPAAAAPLRVSNA